MPTKNENKRVAIIGAGVAGCAVAGALQDYGIEDFIVYDKNARPGGLWADNYPGAKGTSYNAVAPNRCNLKLSSSFHVW